MKNRPSLQAVAKLADVSTATVSRVARGQVNVDARLRERVGKAAQKLGIDLHKWRNEKSTVIAFMLANGDSQQHLQTRILLGAEAFCSSQKRDLLFLSFRYSPSTPARELHLPKIVTQPAMVRAVILSGTNSSNMMAALREREIPFSVLGNNVVGPWDPGHNDTVYSDDIQGAFDLTSRLLAAGHRDIWFIGDTSLPWHARSAQGYRQCMSAAGLEPRMSEIHSDGQQLGYLAMRSILSRRAPASAVFGGSDQIARGIYDALRQSGLRIPHDISVAGFNDSEGSLMDPPLTSVREFPEELGKHLAEFVLTRTQEPGRVPQQLAIPTRVVWRESTRSLSPEELAWTPPVSDARLYPQA